MNAKRLYYGLVPILILTLIGFVGVAYMANKILGSQATTLSTQRAVSEALSAQETTLAKNKQDLVKYSDLNTIAQTVVPQDKDQAEAVREIVNIAAQNGIGKLSSITFPSSTLGLKGASKVNLTQLTPVKGISGVYDLQITVSLDASDAVSYSQFVAFLQGLEQNRRTAQVNSISVQPSPEHPDQVGFTLIIDEYIKP